MTSDTTRRVRDLFEAAMDEQPANLDAWLDRAGEQDAAVRAELASLLAYHARAGSFLDAAIPDAAVRVLSTLDRALAPGAVVGPYAVQREIGRGGMGRVYLATDSRLGRDVALKAIAPEYASDERYRARLRREARAAAALTDPGICGIYALEEIDGQLFIASELVDGRTLREAIDARARPAADQAMAVARGLAAALADAHAHGIVHRDLTPSNVMLRADGRVKVLDFGLAALRDVPQVDASSSRAGALVGTPAYMSPEQLKGDTADAASDVFAFGVVMYEWMTGMHPFHAPTGLAMAARVLEAEPGPIDALRRDVPPVLAAAVHRCLAKARDQRFASGRELAEALSGADPPGDRRPAGPHGGAALAWWRVHQLAIIALYVSACVAAWGAGEFLRVALARGGFVLLAALATAGGVMRGHLLFTERVHRSDLAGESARTRRVLLATDLLIALALAGLGLAIVPASTTAAGFALALAVGIALAALLIEPATSSAAGFGRPQQQD